uniref:Uncharacterized protein n=1 Tax=Rhizophora mucronata TaxID=61149 RepID=A0A2P2QVT8_RHIMU
MMHQSRRFCNNLSANTLSSISVKICFSKYQLKHGK